MVFFPKNPDFFTLYEKLGEIIKLSSGFLSRIKIDFSNIENFIRKTRNLELEADKVCHRLNHLSNNTFITPIDREDVYFLARSLDNVVDLIEDLISKVDTYQIKDDNFGFVEFTKLIRKTTLKVTQLINCLKYREKKLSEIRKLIIKINLLENQGDALFHKKIKALFINNYKDPVKIIKVKDILENMERILDECENIGFIVDEIAVKNF